MNLKNFPHSNTHPSPPPPLHPTNFSGTVQCRCASSSGRGGRGKHCFEAFNATSSGADDDGTPCISAFQIRWSSGRFCSVMYIDAFVVDSSGFPVLDHLNMPISKPWFWMCLVLVFLSLLSCSGTTLTGSWWLFKRWEAPRVCTLHNGLVLLIHIPIEFVCSKFETPPWKKKVKFVNFDMENWIWALTGMKTWIGSK